jgi:hypothetical protein
MCVCKSFVLRLTYIVLSSRVNNNTLECSRSKVLEIASQDHNHSEISRILQISQANIKKYMNETAL